MSAMAVKLRRFKFGWFGDNDHGENLIQDILAGRKRATASLAYEQEDADVAVGETVEIADKHGRLRGTLVILKIEIRAFGKIDEAVANECGHALEKFKELARFANARELKPDEEMRITYFKLLSLKDKVRI